MADKLKIFAVNFWNLNRVDCLACAAPVRAVFQNEIFACASDFVLEWKPRHIKNENPSAVFKNFVKIRRGLFVLEIPEALARGDYVKSSVWKTQIFGRAHEIFNVFSGGKNFRLLNLLF